MRVKDLVTELGATLRGDGATEVTGCAALEDAGPSDLSFLSNARYAGQLATTRAGAVVISEKDAAKANGTPLLIAADPYFAFRQALVLLHGFRPQPTVGIHPQGYIDNTAEIGELCTVRPFAYVAPRARIGDRSVLYPGCYVGKDAVIGNDCVLYPGVCVYDRCVLGDRVTLHANTVIGQDGFGYATAPPGSQGDNSTDGDPGEVVHHKIPQAGHAVIGDDVEMGANCSVDRAAVGQTVVGAGTKFSNNVVIGHGAKIGRHNLLVAFVGIAGSTTTGDYVTMGGHVGVAGHLKIGSHVEIAAAAKVMHDIPENGGQWGGVPARPLTEAKRVVLQQQRLPAMAAKLKALEKRIAELEADRGSGN